MSIKSAIQNIYSMNFCAGSQSEIYLSVSGHNPTYSDSQTDIYNATKLVKSQKIKVDQKINNWEDDNTSMDSEISNKPPKVNQCFCEKMVLEKVMVKVEDQINKFISRMIAQLPQYPRPSRVS
jgi:hypothetical protein